MISKILNRAAGLGAIVVLLAAAALAQTGPIEGTLKVKEANGTLKPVQGALIDIYRLDIKGHWDVKTDKSGHYVRLGMPLVGNYVVLASGPGITPTWVNGVRLTQAPVVDIVAEPGDGATLTYEQLMAAIKGQGGPAPAQISPGDRAKLEAQKKELEAKQKEGAELQATFDQARTHYNQGVELVKTSNYQQALSEFEQAASIDATKSAHFIELSYKSNANLAEAHYQLGVDLFNQKNREAAKPHFEEAVKAVTRAIEVAGNSKEPTINNELIVYYNILVKNAQLLVEFYGAADRIPAVVAAIDKAVALDVPANKAKWEVARGNLYRSAGKTDEAVVAYKSVLAQDPANLDALFNLGLSLLASTEKEKLQESANYLADFVSKAPPTDKRVTDAKTTIEALRNQFKIEAEKPAKRGRAKP
jgi:tetratricopeptide (TPR) repeat protein